MVAEHTIENSGDRACRLKNSHTRRLEVVWKYQNVPFTRAISGASVQALLGPSPNSRAGVGKVHRNDEEII